MNLYSFKITKKHFKKTFNYLLKNIHKFAFPFSIFFTSSIYNFPFSLIALSFLYSFTGLSFQHYSLMFCVRLCDVSGCFSVIPGQVNGSSLDRRALATFREHKDVADRKKIAIFLRVFLNESRIFFRRYYKKILTQDILFFLLVF